MTQRQEGAMDLFDAIARRHSYRGPMLDQPVSRDDLRRIVQAGIQAPSGITGRARASWSSTNPAQLADCGH